jgi:hypothetical protein
MAATRTLLLKTGWIGDVGTVSVIVTAAGVLGSLAIYWAVRGTKADFLFERPARFWLMARPMAKTEPKPRMTLQPAE